MATTDTQLQQLVINVGTDAQIAAGIASGTITEDLLSIATDGADITYDWIGTLEEYNEQKSGGTIDPNWICYITDDEISNELVWGNIIGQVTQQTDLIEYISTHCYQIPSLSGNANKYLTNNGSTTFWENPKTQVIYWD